MENDDVYFIMMTRMKIFII